LQSRPLPSERMNLNTPVEPQELARRIRMIMGDKRWSRKKLAERTGISRPSLSNKLNGDVDFTYAELLAVIEVLEVEWEGLLANPFPGSGGSSEPPPRISDHHFREDRQL
jgi:transcriptional regulator with XRE-family HTH domain